mgnify:FL=1
MEKLLKKADDATAAKRFSEAMTWLKQARVLASAEKQKEIDARMQEVQKQASEGSLFGMAEEPAPVIPQPQGSMNGQPQPGMQTSIFPEQQTHTMNPEPVMLSAPQQNPQEMPQPVYGTNGAYIQPAPNRPVMQGTGMPQGATMQPYPQQPAYQLRRLLIHNNRYGSRQTAIYRTEQYRYRTETDGNTRLRRLHMRHSASIRKTRMTGNF